MLGRVAQACREPFRGDVQLPAGQRHVADHFNLHRERTATAAKLSLKASVPMYGVPSKYTTG